jgi:hypothetical protein
MYGREVVMGEKHNPKKAAQRLTELGRPTEESSLNSWRSLGNGNGPPFYKTGKYILYDDDDLVEFAKSTPMVKYNSTSEYPPELRSKRRKNGGE